MRCARRAFGRLQERNTGIAGFFRPSAPPSAESGRVERALPMRDPCCRRMDGLVEKQIRPKNAFGQIDDPYRGAPTPAFCGVAATGAETNPPARERNSVWNVHGEGLAAGRGSNTDAGSNA